MERRMICVYCTLLLMLTTVIFRIYYINMSGYLAMAAEVQSKYALKIANTRGVIYDRNMKPLVNEKYRYIASVLPTPQAANALLDLTPDEERDGLMARLTSGTPFALGISGNSVHARGVDVFRIPDRYGGLQLAPHIVGYLSGDGKNGVAGIEKSYDDWLIRCGTEIEVRYQVDAAGQVMQGGAIDVERAGDTESAGGVSLTIDRNFQILTQNALQNGCDKGAAVVMDVHTGDILAMASIPSFNQSDIAASFESEDAPFINRAASGYSIGSVFKILISASALESGISTSYSYECKGYVELGGLTFRCNNHAVHGTVDMQRALQVSCNTYFIDLARNLDPQYTLTLLSGMGLGTARELAPDFYTQSGNLPTALELAGDAPLANFSFGQGSSLATPLQIAGAIATAANTGVAVVPRLVRGLTPDGVNITEPTAIYTSNRVISEKTAETLRQLMVGVIDGGSGRTGKPLLGGAGGKTSSAQTGQLKDGEEIVHAWFAGFYPAEKPQYSIVVFVEGGQSGERVAAPIFKQIADGISGLKAYA